ncbi:bromodomain-containing protein 8-like [Pelobates fuscus]|uniref:bromodomain-containing protein 8-like n=1 Tax=Pelobates fuscus TaxID=191477 RepID=UPI002FE4FA4F
MGRELHHLSGDDWDKLVRSWSTSINDFCETSVDQKGGFFVLGEDVPFDRQWEIAGVLLHAEAQKVLLPILYQILYHEEKSLCVNPMALDKDNNPAVSWSPWGSEISLSVIGSESNVSNCDHQHEPPLLTMLNLRTSETSQYLVQFKKSLTTVWKTIVSHRFSGPFMKPVSDKQAPGYQKIVKRPMDLVTVKRGVSKGRIKSIVEFQQNVMLVFQNAIMYNSSNHVIYHKAIEMQHDTVELLQVLNLH